MGNNDEPVDVPTRYSRVDPWVISSDTDAEVTFLATVFGGRETPGSRILGERVARVRDPQGHLWWIHQRLEDVPAEELADRFADPSALQAMAYVQQSLVSEMSGTR